MRSVLPSHGSRPDVEIRLELKRSQRKSGGLVKLIKGACGGLEALVRSTFSVLIALLMTDDIFNITSADRGPAHDDRAPC